MTRDALVRDVVITGVGCLGPWGIGLDALAQALGRGVPHGTAIDRSQGYHRRNGATLVGSCAALDLTPWVSPQAARRMSDLSRFAVAAARQALAAAGLPDVRGERTAIAVATTFGPGAYTDQLARQIIEKGGKAASPFLFTDCVANAASGQIGIELGVRGPNVTICQREAGPLLALGQGTAEIARGRADVCLAGAVDEMKPLVHAQLDRFGALARPEPHGEAPRPFDRRRNGALACEGATIVVLEEERRARARGARILARVGPTVRAFDPTASRAGYGRDAAGLASTLRGRAGRHLAEVDAVVSGASGRRAGDALDAAVLRAALPHGPRVLVPKAVHGEYGGGTLAAALLALGPTEFAFPAACDRPDPRLGIVPAHGCIAARSVLLSALAAGGAAAWTLLDQP